MSPNGYLPVVTYPISDAMISISDFHKAVTYMNLKVLSLLSSACFMVLDVALYINPADGQVRIPALPPAGQFTDHSSVLLFHYLSRKIMVVTPHGLLWELSAATFVTCLEWCLAHRQCYGGIWSFWMFLVLGKEEKPVIYDGFIIRAYWILREKLHSIFVNGGLEHSLHSHRKLHHLPVCGWLWAEFLRNDNVGT